MCFFSFLLKKKKKRNLTYNKDNNLLNILTRNFQKRKTKDKIRIIL